MRRSLSSSAFRSAFQGSCTHRTSYIAHPYHAHVDKQKDQPSGARGIGFGTIPQHKRRRWPSPIRCLGRSPQDLLGHPEAQPQPTRVTHHTFVGLLAVQAEVSIGQLFELNAGLNIYLRCATPRHLPPFLLTRVHRPIIYELSNVIIDAMGQDQRQIMVAEDSDNTGMATPFVRLGVHTPDEV